MMNAQNVPKSLWALSKKQARSALISHAGTALLRRKKKF
jgi:hypothetical protein